LDKPSTFTVKLYNKVIRKDESLVQVIRCNIPYVKEDIPLVLLFRALGFTTDKEILEMMCSDLTDKPFIELIKASFDEAGPGSEINNNDFALDYISKRTNNAAVLKERRIQYGREILKKKLLPHLKEHNDTKKGFFIGYMVQRLCSAALGRSGEDDRDHYGKKRLDMIGMLMRDLFKTKF
jgi:DNA-directed RNA polymerase II subunit RPB2